MKTIALVLLAFIAVMSLNTIATQLGHEAKLREKELLLHEMEIISQQCDSKSGSVNFETGDLHCDPKKQAEKKQFKSTAMPNDI